MLKPCTLTSQRGFCDEARHAEDETEGYWWRRWQKVRRRRARMHQQIASAQLQLRASYDLGRQRLVEQGRLSPEEAERWARIDGRLHDLQANHMQLEWYDRRKQFHPDFIAKRLALKKGERV